ncbi:MAG: hypothetical protein ACI4UN_01415 [Muribaculaceae bacterium]
MILIDFAMNQFDYTTPGSQAAAASTITVNGIASAELKTVKKPGAKRNNARANERKRLLAIRQFLDGLQPYQADALRISLKIADGVICNDNMSADDRLTMNRYLNCGIRKEQSSAEQILALRLGRAVALLQSASQYCDKIQMNLLYQTVTALAANNADIEDARAKINRVVDTKAGAGTK